MHLLAREFVKDGVSCASGGSGSDTAF